MKRRLAILGATAAVLTVGSVSFAQQPQPATQGTVVVRQRVMQGPDGPPAPPGDVMFMATEMISGKTVKGAPYSAQAVTETVQTLGDGNRIVNKMTSQLYRDSEGRTRREQSMKMLGLPGDAADSRQTIFINDPVTGNNYILDSKSHTAHKMMTFKFEQGPPGVEGRRFEFKTTDGGPGVMMRTPDTPMPPPRVPGVPAESGNFTFKIEAETAGGATYLFRTGGPSENEVKEQLGRQTIEGVEADGTRTTVTIPVGEIGNERPIEIVSERWYSPELQMVIMTKHNDPRSGETTYRLTNITRTEPAKSLFEVPADYTVKADGPGAPSVMTLPAKVHKPE
ncbi:MAG TPA: hypothetical protein VI306_18185 [Pyrinomonadaceae bacterium]